MGLKTKCLSSVSHMGAGMRASGQVGKQAHKQAGKQAGRQGRRAGSQAGLLFFKDGSLLSVFKTRIWESLPVVWSIVLHGLPPFYQMLHLHS